jgi:CRISPR-associated protein Csm1
MISPTALKIALAGLLHDIGKFCDGSVLALNTDYYDGNQALYQPHYKGNYSHRHALFTAAFFDDDDVRPCLPPALLRDGFGEGGILQNLAAMHHKPENKWQQIVTVADRLASGLERKDYEDNQSVRPQDYLSTRLQSIFAQVQLTNHKATATDFHTNAWHALTELQGEESFPRHQDDPRKFTNKQQAIEEYSELWRSFKESLSTIPNRAEDELHLWAEHLNSLLRDTTSLIPSARAGKTMSDVSLYDHSHAVASLSCALYLYHSAQTEWDERSLQDDEAAKFLLVSGDFLGIQQFIFAGEGESKENRTRLLRGRSVFVSLFTRAIGDLVCRRAGVPPFAGFVNIAAGKFVLLLPNTAEANSVLAETREEVNQWMYSNFLGEQRFILASVQISPKELNSGSGGNTKGQGYAAARAKLFDESEYQKYSAAELSHSFGVVANYHAEISRYGVCKVCQHRPATSNKEQGHCAVCADLKCLGQIIIKNESLSLVESGNASNEILELLLPGGLTISLGCEHSSTTWQMWRTQESLDSGTYEQGAGYIARWRLGGYAKRDPFGDLASFEQLAEAFCQQNERGLNAIASLKADVDNLGKIFIDGLASPSMARMNSLSRMLHHFFAEYVPQLLSEHYPNTYTVFAGGDDLFVIGNWHEILGLAVDLKKKFNQCCANNPSVTLSVGVDFHKAHTPIDVIGRGAEHALELAKQGSKNQVAVFGEVVTLNELQRLYEIADDFEVKVDQRILSEGLFYRFNEFVEMREQEHAIQAGQGSGDLRSLTWRSALAYQLVRNMNVDEEEQRRTEIKGFIAGVTSDLEQYGSKYKIAVWRGLYSRREG